MKAGAGKDVPVLFVVAKGATLALAVGVATGVGVDEGCVVPTLRYGP